MNRPSFEMQHPQNAACLKHFVSSEVHTVEVGLGKFLLFKIVQDVCVMLVQRPWRFAVFFECGSFRNSGFLVELYCFVLFTHCYHGMVLRLVRYVVTGCFML